MESKENILPVVVLVLTATMAGLIAGLFYSWSCSVIPGLSRLSDKNYLAAMQSINKAILNPVFFVSFIGTLVLLPLSTYQFYIRPLSIQFWLLAIATLIYTIGVFGVTVFGNVPLNDQLAAFNLSSAGPAEIVAHRMKFEGAWNNFNTLRTISAVSVLVLVIICCTQMPVSGK
ncbi:DUF1772 domain-containing protein [Pedobacter sp.]|jgi:uncharacterized membrane protein|uniref:anthrone oxygenase family protein n=1 Tax=Pedobacter sp. TaxID=1411316 RepID=UPI002BCEF3F6|nr:anthrone oxygenase family protein [Pedobacter sp.]HWW42398.1 anthrone oxygenase family protein [Pedobacter sp.]